MVVDIFENARRRREGGAFTLIELLVVISILAIIAALLLPALSYSKSSAGKTVDISNLKQISLAMFMYAEDDFDTLPWPNWGPSSTRSGWLYTLDSSATGSARFKIEKGLLWPGLTNPKLYRCPLDGDNSPLFTQRQQQLSTYAMNGAIVGYNRANSNVAVLAAMQPGDVAFWESDEKQPEYFNDGANYPAEGVSARHANGAINATFDGAVGYVRLGAWYVQVYETNKNSLWCYPETRNGR